MTYYYGSLEITCNQFMSDLDIWFWSSPRQPVSSVPLFSCCDSLKEYYISERSGTHVELPPPSETLRDLIRSFPETKAAAPLLDRLLEEYPQLHEPFTQSQTAEAVA